MTHIYALVSGQLILYVGSTNRLKKREHWHRHSKYNYTTSRYIPDYIDWTMKLLETVPDEQRTIKEQLYYDTLKPLYNRYRPGQTQSERDASTARKEYQKKRGQTEQYKLYQKEYRLKKKSETPVDVI
jgi:predicted GIY-YIG superfamily endonuclease